jgi:hypothetical protein
MVKGHGAAADKLRVEDQEWQAAKVIAVQVGQKHRLDAVRINLEATHGDERRGTAVDQETRFRRLDVEAGVEPAA